MYLVWNCLIKIKINFIFITKNSCEWQNSCGYDIHTVCTQMIRKFLECTRSRDNDLSIPRNSSEFPSLRESDSTQYIILQYVKYDELRKYAFGNNNRRQIKNKT
ncbi:unnamed protein product [Rotaria sordida]|uniref:Uncharacterized protein n=1 Tax=Rotaria sordida TaxID=392033 RepID=A0A813YKQ8_9BILA|nr:unnamed protein product [Rotaria sordida]CAF3588592.1 unnamed protein product [Rotaria sordida]